MVKFFYGTKDKSISLAEFLAILHIVTWKVDKYNEHAQEGGLFEYLHDNLVLAGIFAVSEGKVV